MSLSSTTARNDYQGADSVGPFVYAFRIFAASDLEVTRRSSGGAETRLTYLTDYTVAGVGNRAGGSITLTGELATGERLTIRRVPPIAQTTDLRNLGAFFPETVEDQLDRLAMIDQAQQDQLGRALTLGPTHDPAAYDLRLPAPEAGKVIVGTEAGFALAALDSSAVALPGDGRLVPTLSAYLQNNAIRNVLDYAVPGVPITTGVNDASPAFQQCLDRGGYILVPEGTYKLNSDLILKVDNTRILGAGMDKVTLVRTAGNVFRNYAGLDTDTAYGNTVVGFRCEELTLQGGFLHTDVFAAPTNSWYNASGRDKVLTTVNLNCGFRFKIMHNGVFDRVKFTQFHRGVFQAGAVMNTFRNCIFGESQIGFYTENGAAWGDASFKCTTQRVYDSGFQNDWFGAYVQDLTDQSHFARNVFEPCNTAVYAVNGGDVQLSDYYERCYEGFVLNGGFAATFTLITPHFTGVPGNFWGNGKSIYLMATAAKSAVIRILGSQTFGGGGVQIDAGRLVVDYPLPGIAMNNRVEVRAAVNRAIYPDPFFARGGFMIDIGAGITSMVLGTDELGEPKLTFTGTGGGLAFNGIRLFLLNKQHRVPLKLKYQYRYTGTTVGFTPFGPHFGAPTNGWVTGTNVSDTGGKWVQVDEIITNVNDFGNAYAQGGFNGTFELKNLFLSEGYGPAEAYPKNAVAAFTSDNIPSARPACGPWNAGDIVYNNAPAEAGVAGSKYLLVGWLCTVGGTPGTWLPLRSLTGN